MRCARICGEERATREAILFEIAVSEIQIKYIAYATVLPIDSSGNNEQGGIYSVNTLKAIAT